MLGDLPTMVGTMSRKSGLITLGQLMRSLRRAADVTLSEAARAVQASRGHLSHVEAGRDRPGWDIVAYYEEHFHGEGVLWSQFVAVSTVSQPQRRGLAPPDGTRYPIEGDRSEFVADLTIPDGTVMPPLFIFEKVWQIRNAGPVLWTERLLARQGAAGGHGIPSSPTRVPIPDAMPGETIEVAVPLRAAGLPGTSQAHWKMVDTHGYEYFPTMYPQGLIMTITVREGAPEPDVTRSDR